MTSFTSVSDKAAHESSLWFESEICVGVRYKIARISLGRRIELARRVREIGRKAEFLEAGDDVRDKLEAAIDGEAATPGVLIERGPLALAMEILDRIRAECGLSETERKNS
jgi:hypothetical protein